MSKVSVVMPSRNDRYLFNTVEGLLEQSSNNTEIIVVLDGPTEFLIPKESGRVQILKNEVPEGMRSSINKAVKASSGDYILKLDSHTIMGKGFDDILLSEYEEDWIVTTRRYELDTSVWGRMDIEPVDYFYTSCPWTHSKMFLIQSCPWVSRTRNRQNVLIDEQMTIHGAMWFMSTNLFTNFFGELDNEGYGGFAGEPLEIGMKAWLGGKKLMVNKNTWYAHPHYKKGEGPNYSVRSTNMYQGLIWGAHYWIENRWEQRIHNFDWLIDKFWPLPLENTRCNGEKYYWPEDWRKYYNG